MILLYMFNKCGNEEYTCHKARYDHIKVEMCFLEEKHQKNMMLVDLVMNFIATNVLDTKERSDTRIRKNNVLIKGMQEDN